MSHKMQKRNGDHQREDRALDAVGDVDRRRRLVESEALLEDKGRVNPGRQAEDGEDESHGEAENNRGAVASE
jgi:hypothetical protein